MTVVSLVVIVVATPAAFETLAFPEERMPTILESEKFKTRFESARISILPVLPRLTTALESGPVTIVLPEIIVEFDTAFWPFTETWPVTVISPVRSFVAASPTMEYTHNKAAAVNDVVILRKQFLPSI
jgi:hypothetical protein